MLWVTYGAAERVDGGPGLKPPRSDFATAASEAPAIPGNCNALRRGIGTFKWVSFCWSPVRRLSHPGEKYELNSKQ